MTTESWVQLSKSDDLISSENLESLMLDAQRESSRSSANSSRAQSSLASPKGVITPPLLADSHGRRPVPIQETTASDWVWDWSSRPEIEPPPDFAERFRHPPRAAKPDNGDDSTFTERLIRIITHIGSFALGAAVMYLFLRKVRGWCAASASDAVLLQTTESASSRFDFQYVPVDLMRTI